MQNVIVLNADMTFLSIVSWKRALKLIHKGKVEIIKESHEKVKNFSGSKIFCIPEVIKLVYFIKKVYSAAISFNKKNVLIRDHNKCQYCGVHGSRLTLDHIVPTSKGGKTNWTNCVAACSSCNTKKGSKTLEQSGMVLKTKPYAPSVGQFLYIKNQLFGFDADIL